MRAHLPPAWSLRAGTFWALLLVVLFPALSLGLLAEEKTAVSLCQKMAQGVVNVSSKAMDREFLASAVPRRGSGTGFVFDHLGHVVTNGHVISDVHSLEVTLPDGQKWPARLVGADDLTDIAVLEILAPQEVLAAVPPLPLGITKDLKVGQAAFALGNPFGTGPTVSAGVIHAPRRSVSTPSGRLIDSVIQTDISIHSGNSGGPLIDSSGRVIGINTLIFGDPRELLGLGFALSSEVVQDVASQLTTTGRVSRPWLGAKLQAVEPALAGILGLPVERGAMITDVVEKGPVDRAGMQGCNKELRLGNRRYPVGGDIIVAIDGEGVESDAAVIQVLSRKKPGEEVLVSFYREERLRRFRVRLEEKPADSRR